MRGLSIIVVFMVLAATALAQDNLVVYNDPTEVTVENLLQLHKNYNSEYSSIVGYRIQVFKGSGNMAPKNAQVIMDEFWEKYPETGAYISFQEPYYRVRVGDFRTRLEALNFINKIKKSYPSAFVIQSNIELVVLPKNNSYE